MSIDYKFNEDKLIDQFKKYIDSTYDGHYGQGGLQSSEIIVDRGHGQGFFHGNIDKYNGRYGKKGDSPDDWRKDIMKIIHYGFLALYEHDRTYATWKKRDTEVHAQEKIDIDTFEKMLSPEEAAEVQRQYDRNRLQITRIRKDTQVVMCVTSLSIATTHGYLGFFYYKYMRDTTNIPRGQINGI